MRQRKKDLKVTEDKWDAVWMLTIVKRQKRIDKFIHQALRDVVKLGGDDVIKNFEEKFKQLRVEGCCRDGGSSSSVIYTEDVEMTEDLPDNHYTEAEMEEIDTMFMGTER